MQRRYREKKYYCGEYLEVAIYPVYSHPKKRGKRSKPTTEIQQRLNQRHTEGRLRRLLHTNFTPSDLFATLTFDDTNLPASVYETAQPPPSRRRLFSSVRHIGIYRLISRIIEYSFSSVPSFKRIALGLTPVILNPIFSYKARARLFPSTNSSSI